jgi:hypothetical protein
MAKKIWTVAAMIATALETGGRVAVQIGRGADHYSIRCIIKREEVSQSFPEANSLTITFVKVTAEGDEAITLEMATELLKQQKALTPKPKSEKRARKDYHKGIAEGVKRAAKAAKAERAAAKAEAKAAKKEEKRIRKESPGLAAALDQSVAAMKAEKKAAKRSNSSDYKLAKPGKLGWAITYTPKDTGIPLYYSIAAMGYATPELAAVFLNKKDANRIADEHPKEINAKVVQHFAQ